MSKTLVKDIVTLIERGWRPYSLDVAPESIVYDRLDCPYAANKKGKMPVWFVRGDIFLCLGCVRRCCLSRPEGFMTLLPLRYSVVNAPYALTPWEMVERRALLQVHEVAYCLNISDRNVYTWIDEGKLRSTNDKPVRVPVEDVKFKMLDLDE